MAFIASALVACNTFFGVGDLSFTEECNQGNCAFAGANSLGGFTGSGAVGTGGSSGSRGGTPGSGGTNSGGQPGRGGTESTIVDNGGAGSGGSAAAGAGGTNTGGGGSAGKGQGDECLAHRECSERNGGKAYECRDGWCIPLTNDDSLPEMSGDCWRVLGEQSLAKGDDVFVFGALTVRSERDPQAPATVNYEFAVQEFAEHGGVTITGKRRKPVVVLCDIQGLTRDRLRKTLDHLTETVGVSGIVAPLFVVDDLNFAFEYANRDPTRSVFLVNPLGAITPVAAMPNPALLWHMLGPPEDVVHVYYPVIARAQAYVRSVRHLDPRTRLKIAVIDNPGVLESTMSAAINEQLSPGTNHENYLRIRITNGSGPVYEEQLESLRQFLPDLVVVTAGSDATRMIGRLELTWSLRAPGRPRPFYVVSPTVRGASGVLVQELSSLREEAPDLFSRMAGINFSGAEDPRLYDEYLSAFRITYLGSTDYAIDGTENFYDAVYYLLFAASAAGTPAAGGNVLKGTDIARGMTRLIAGPDFDVGFRSLPKVNSALLRESSISLHGTLGPPDFDPATGTRSTNGSVWCIRPSAGEFPFEFVFDTLRYDKITKRLSGDFACNDAF